MRFISALITMLIVATGHVPADPHPVGDTVSDAVSWLEIEANRILRASKREMDNGMAAFPPRPNRTTRPDPASSRRGFLGKSRSPQPVSEWGLLGHPDRVVCLRSGSGRSPVGGSNCFGLSAPFQAVWGLRMDCWRTTRLAKLSHQRGAAIGWHQGHAGAKTAYTCSRTYQPSRCRRWPIAIPDTQAVILQGAIPCEHD